MFYKTLPLRCGRNNCKEFRSWAEPTADCCVTIPKDNKPPEINVTLISKIKDVILDESDETTIYSHDENLGKNKLMAWNVKFKPKFQSQKYIEFRFVTSEDKYARKAENERESWARLKSGEGKKDKGHTRNKNKKLSKNMSQGTKGKKDRDTMKGGKKNVHRGGRRPRSLKKGKGGKKKRHTGEKKLNKGKRGIKEKKKKKSTKKNTQEKKSEQTAKSGAEDGESQDCSEDGWVKIVEGGRKRSNPFVIMNNTCLSKLPSSTITVYSDQAQVYFKKGSSGREFELTVKPLDHKDPTKCLEDCEWKENEHYHETSFWRIGGWNVPNPCSFDADIEDGNDGDEQGCVQLQFTMALVPKDLSCLDDCFSDVEREKKKYKKFCKDNIRSAIEADALFRRDIDPFSFIGQSDDKDIDCILFNRMSDSKPEERNDTFVSLSLIPELGQRRRRSFFTKQEETTTPTNTTTTTTTTPRRHFFSNFLPETPFDLALMFCIMANLDTRSKLNILNGFPETSNKIWNNKTCTPFLPKLDYEESFEEDPLQGASPTSRGTLYGSLRSAPNTRQSGPSSSTIQR